jgi:hypothetical protein
MHAGREQLQHEADRLAHFARLTGKPDDEMHLGVEAGRDRGADRVSIRSVSPSS